MSRSGLRKIILVISGGLTLLLLALVIILPLLFDPNDYKDDIIQWVKSNTGRELQIPGQIKLSVFPWLGVELGEVRLGNAPGFAKTSFLQLKRLAVHVKLWPLLRNEKHIDQLRIDGLVLNLARNQAGLSNWQDLQPKPTSPDKSKTAPEASSPVLALPSALVINGIEIRDASINWSDAHKAQHIQIKHLDITSGPLLPGQAFPLQIGWQFSTAAPKLTGDLHFASEVTLDPVATQLALKAVELQLTLLGVDPGNPLQGQTRIQNVQFDLQQQTLDVNKLHLTLANLDLQGDFHTTHLTTGARTTGALRLKEFSLRKLLTELGMAVPATADPQVLERAHFSAQVSATPDQVKLQNLNIGLDDTTLKGDVRVSQLERPQLRYTLHIDTFNADRYLPPQTETPAATPGSAVAAGASQPLPLETLRQLDIQGKLTIDRLTLARLQLTQLQTTLRARQGRIRLFPLKAQLYQGQYSGDLGLDVRSTNPQVSANESLRGVQIEPLLQDATGQARLTGSANIAAKITARGQNPQQLRQSLTGNARFEFKNGAIKGINLAQEIRRLKAKLQNKPLPRDDAPKQTDFTSITGSAQITNGVVQNKDLQALSPYLRVKGQGRFDLVREQINYRAETVIVKTAKGQGGKDLGDLVGIPIPLKIKGSFAKPAIKFDEDRLMEVLFKGEIEKKADKLFDRLFNKKRD